MAPIDPRSRVGIIAFLTLFASACAGGQAEQPRSGAMDPGIGHVHGLGVDPSDGSIYVAAHFGLFQVRSASSAVRVANRLQDHMGFTVVGPKTFLASGHPALETMPEGAPPHLGLIRTTDAGLTWTAVSEAGISDFHSLQPAGTSLYAYDSQTGRVRRSLDDGRTWIEGAKAQVVDLAGNADLPDHVYATSPDGPQMSDDGGKSFTAITGAPLLTHLDLPRKGVLIGVGPDGTVHTSRDDGKSWSTVGRIPGQATAFTALDERWLLAATEDGAVHESTDGGTTFSVAYRPVNG